MDLPSDPATFVVTGLGSGFMVYLALGLLFAIPFVLRGAGRLDPLARTGSWGFRLAILPGVVIFWLPLAMRWMRAVKGAAAGDLAPPLPRTPHTLRARLPEEHA